MGLMTPGAMRGSFLSIPASALRALISAAEEAPSSEVVLPVTMRPSFSSMATAGPPLSSAFLSAAATTGLSAEEILQKLLDTALDASIYLTVDDLKYLKRGGRITPSVAAIGTVLNIKPVLQIQGGKLDTYKKVRGLHAAQNTMLDAIRKDLETRFADMPMLLRTAYTGDADVGRVWNAQVQECFPQFEVTGDPLPISIACHVGPGTLALGLMKRF